MAHSRLGIHRNSLPRPGPDGGGGESEAHGLWHGLPEQAGSAGGTGLPEPVPLLCRSHGAGTPGFLPLGPSSEAAAALSRDGVHAPAPFLRRAGLGKPGVRFLSHTLHGDPEALGGGGLDLAFRGPLMGKPAKLAGMPCFRGHGCRFREPYGRRKIRGAGAAVRHHRRPPIACSASRRFRDPAGRRGIYVDLNVATDEDRASPVLHQGPAVNIHFLPGVPYLRYAYREVGPLMWQPFPERERTPTASPVSRVLPEGGDPSNPACFFRTCRERFSG